MEANKNEIHILGHIFSIELILVISIFIIGIIILIVGLVVDSIKPRVVKPNTMPIYKQQSNTQQSYNSNYKTVIKTTPQTQPNKKIVTKLDSNYSKDSEHVYVGQKAEGNYLLNLDKDKIKIVGDYITDGKRLYNRSWEIQLGDSNIDLNSLQNAGKTYIRDSKNVYAIIGFEKSYKLEKVNINVNQMEFFWDGGWEYIKDNNKVYYLRGDLERITEVSSKKDDNGVKQLGINGTRTTNTGLIDFIRGAESIYIKDLRKLNENYNTDGKKLYLTSKGFVEKEIQLGNYNIDFKTISALGKFYIKDKNNIYAVVRKEGNKYGIKKLDLDIKNAEFLSSQYEYINYDKNIKKGYCEYIKDQNKVYYMREIDYLWIVKTMIEVPNAHKTISMSGESYNQGDKEWKLLLGDVDNNNISTNEFFTNKTIIDFVSTVNSVEKE